MRYYAQYENDKLIAIGTGLGGVEISKDEYDSLLAMIREKARLVDEVYTGAITIADVPVEWQEEIQRRVDERIAMEGEISQEEISDEEFVNMLEGVL